ncbi:MAG TPA: hypothetical protein VIZ65_02630 [Cellvibrionaceae bacterium]
MSLQRCAWLVISARLFGLSIVYALTLNAARAETAAPSDLVSNNKSAEKLRLFTSAHSITYAENISIDAWMDDLHTTDTSPGEYAFTRNFSELGFAYGQMSFAGFVRQDYYLHFSQDTFDLVYQDKNDIPFDANRRYEILLDVSHVQIHGAKVGYDFSPLKSLQTRIEANFFDAEEVLFGTLDGYLGTNAGKIKGDLSLDYNYTEDVVLDRPLTPPASGRGQSVDVELWWQPIEKLNTHFLAEDLYSQIKWSQTPFTQATITTVRTVTDSSGAVRRAPTISGREYFRQVKQRIPRHFQADIGYQIIEPLRIEVVQERYDELAFNRFMAHYRVWPKFELGLGYDEKARAPRLEVASPYLSLMASADSTDGKKAKFVTFSAAVRIAF